MFINLSAYKRLDLSYHLERTQGVGGTGGLNVAATGHSREAQALLRHIEKGSMNPSGP
jgi:hypothetical protein